MAYDSSLETDIELPDKIVENLDEVQMENVVETEHPREQNLISMNNVIPEELIISIPMIVKNERTNLTLPLKDFFKVVNHKGWKQWLFLTAHRCGGWEEIWVWFEIPENEWKIWGKM